MSFGDLKSEAGLKKLNDFLAENSYIQGFTPSAADVSTLKSVGAKAPDAKKFPHAARWFRHIQSYSEQERKAFGAPGAAAAADDDDDVDLFGSDDDEEEESEEAKKVREERLAAYAAKKSKKPALIAKTSVLLDCKPWDDETDLDEMLKLVKEIEMDGLLWGASKTVPLAFGIKKLQVMCVVEDAKVSIDELQEKICDLEDHVQSCDVAAMNKI